MSARALSNYLLLIRNFFAINFGGLSTLYERKLPDFNAILQQNKIHIEIIQNNFGQITRFSIY